MQFIFVLLWSCASPFLLGVYVCGAAPVTKAMVTVALAVRLCIVCSQVKKCKIFMILAIFIYQTKFLKYINEMFTFSSGVGPLPSGRCVAPQLQTWSCQSTHTFDSSETRGDGFCALCANCTMVVASKKMERERKTLLVLNFPLVRFLSRWLNVFTGVVKKRILFLLSHCSNCLITRLLINIWYRRKCKA